MLNRRTILGGVAAGALTLPSVRTRAAPPKPIRIGVVTDMSGVYRDVQGPGSVACTQQAAEEFTAANPDIKIEIVVGDHQNKPDVAV
jgi:branched-chain amino acid transport system substrate-binding protein